MTPPGQVATLILPGDTAWDEGTGPGAGARRARARARVSEDAVKEAARVLRSGEPAVLLITGLALREKGLELAGAHRGEDRRDAAGADLQPPHGARRGAHLGRAHSLSGRAGARACSPA